MFSFCFVVSIVGEQIKNKVILQFIYIFPQTIRYWLYELATH